MPEHSAKEEERRFSCTPAEARLLRRALVHWEGRGLLSAEQTAGLAATLTTLAAGGVAAARGGGIPAGGDAGPRGGGIPAGGDAGPRGGGRLLGALALLAGFCLLGALTALVHQPQVEAGLERLAGVAAAGRAGAYGLAGLLGGLVCWRAQRRAMRGAPVAGLLVEAALLPSALAGLGALDSLARWRGEAWDAAFWSGLLLWSVLLAGLSWRLRARWSWTAALLGGNAWMLWAGWQLYDGAEALLPDLHPRGRDLLQLQHLSSPLLQLGYGALLVWGGLKMRLGRAGFATPTRRLGWGLLCLSLWALALFGRLWGRLDGTLEVAAWSWTGVFFLFGLGLLAWGYGRRTPPELAAEARVLGALALFANLYTKFLQLDWGLWNKPLGFALLGLSLGLGCWWLVRRRKARERFQMGAR